VILAVAALIANAGRSYATIDYSSVGATYTQNFNSLASSGTGSIGWENDATIEGWHLFRIKGINSNSIIDHTPYPIVSYEVSNGSASAKRFYSFGDNPTINDRALGANSGGYFGDVAGHVGNIGYGYTLGWIAASIQNNTGGVLTRFTLMYDGEQWHDGSDSPQTMVFQYGFGTTFNSVATWLTPVGSFDYVSPVNNAAGAAVDGNAAGRVANRGGTITNLAWQPGSTFWLRWAEFDDGGPDHGLAIDNVSFSASSDISAVPEPGAIFFGGLVFVIVGLVAASRPIVGLLQKVTLCRAQQHIDTNLAKDQEPDFAR
jgi:hypothetical protein